jgi:hypothetical protein
VLARRWLAALACALVLAGCARGAVERAVAARGGLLHSSYREVDGSVHQGFPGEWSWEISYRTPDLLRWTIHTYGEDQSYVYDGRRVVLHLGTATLPVDPAAAAGFRTQARWFAVTSLDVLTDASLTTWEEIPVADLPPGVRRGLRASFRDGSGPYLLFFDDRDLLVAAEGDVALPPIGSGRLRADWQDFRDVGGFVLPFAGRYTLDGRPLMDERVRQWIPNDPTLTPASFAAPP